MAKNNTISVSTGWLNGKVALIVDDKVLGEMTPQQAREYAQNLLEVADEAECGHEGSRT